MTCCKERVTPKVQKRGLQQANIVEAVKNFIRKWLAG